MNEKLLERNASSIKLMRSVAASFDESMETYSEQYAVPISYGWSTQAIAEKARIISGIQFFNTSEAIPSTDLIEQDNIYLRDENRMLWSAVRELEERLAIIEAHLQDEKVIILRDISKDEAKKEIMELFSSGRTLYYSDIAHELGLDLEQVVDICNELQDQGEITLDA